MYSVSYYLEYPEMLREFSEPKEFQIGVITQIRVRPNTFALRKRDHCVFASVELALACEVSVEYCFCAIEMPEGRHALTAIGETH